MRLSCILLIDTQSDGKRGHAKMKTEITVMWPQAKIKKKCFKPPSDVCEVGKVLGLLEKALSYKHLKSGFLPSSTERVYMSVLKSIFIMMCYKSQAKKMKSGSSRHQRRTS